MRAPQQQNPPNEENVENALKLFANVKQGLEVNKSLGWALAVDTLKACLVTLDEPETVEFMDELFLKMISILTNQGPSKLGNFERKSIDDSLSLAISILLQQLPGDQKYLCVLTRILDPTCPYYAGAKVSWTYYPGFPLARVQMAKKFAEGGGFGKMFEVLKAQNERWIGAQDLYLILRGMNDAVSCVDDATRDALVSEVMRTLLALSDEQVKRENTEHLSNLIRVIGQLMEVTNKQQQQQPQQQQQQQFLQPIRLSPAFHAFWLEHTLKVVGSGSLVLKLFAWDQVYELIRTSVFTRPYARSYMVSGAGTDFVNGLYECVRQDGDSLVYAKTPTGPDMPLLTLFRCTMRTKSKWWFISQADKDKPGTDKDIDYYEHKSIGDEEKEPQRFGWLPAGNNNSRGKEPAPTLQPVDYLFPENVDRDSFLFWRLPRWALDNDVLGGVFSQSSLHREIVSRSGKLVSFLAEADALDISHLTLIWKAALLSHDNDIVDEIFLLLAQASIQMKYELFAALIDLVIEALEKEGAPVFVKVASFAEKFATDFGLNKDIAGFLSEESAAKLLSLVWTIYRNPTSNSLKNFASIQELLSRCLNQKGGVAMALQRVQECAATLQAYAATPVPPNELPEAAAERESIISRIILTLQFLLARHTGPASIDELDREGFASVILGEINRFVSANRTIESATLEETGDREYASHIQERLQILRMFYGIVGSNIRMPFKVLETLWVTFKSHPRELDEFFLLLNRGAVKYGAFEEMLPLSGFLRAFNTFVCHPDIDWSLAGDLSFQCFQKYYTGHLFVKPPPDAPQDTLLPPRLGLETLWNVVLNAPSPMATKGVTELLLNAYRDLSCDDALAHFELVQRIFSELRIAQAKAVDGVLPADSFARVNRCVGILSGAISRSKSQAAEPAHAVRSCMSRVKINVYHKKASSFFSPTTQQEVVRVEKGSESVLNLEVHPLQTILDLKMKIFEKTGLGPVSKISIDKTVKQGQWKDSTRLSTLNLTDGSEVSATYLVTFGVITKPIASIDDASEGTDEGVVGAPQVGQLITGDQDQFNLLLSLCESIDDVKISKKIWELVMLVPSQKNLLAAVEEACLEFAPSATEESNFPRWGELFRGKTPGGAGSIARMTYLLQIIDNIMQPAPEFRTHESVSQAIRFRANFIASGGFSAVLKVLETTPSTGKEINRDALAAALHIINFLLFGDKVKGSDGSGGAAAAAVEPPVAVTRDSSTSSSSSATVVVEDSDMSIADGGGVSSSGVILDLVPEVASALLAELQKHAGTVAEKLLAVASDAAAIGGSGVVSNALKTITFLIRSSQDVSSQLVGNPQSRTLLTTVLRSTSKSVREMAADFAIEVGRSQPVVFSWLQAELESLDSADTLCADSFRALGALMTDLNSVEGAIDLKELAALLFQRLSSYRGVRQVGGGGEDEKQVLAGYLNLLEKLIRVQPSLIVGTEFGDSLVRVFLNDFLFTMPTEAEQDRVPICDTLATRKAALSVLSAYLALSPASLAEVVADFSKLTSATAAQMRTSWNMQVSHDVKRPDILFSGLKNQGCTCYMNSLLQQLFMNTSFREAILSTQIRESDRVTVWHRPPEELVGLELLFEWSNGSWLKGKVTNYDASSLNHTIRYEDAEGTDDESIVMNIHEGRYQKETGRVRVVSAVADPEVVALTERDEAAIRVLEQLQRTFCFMQSSKRRYFDPRPFVDACKTLNLNFNVFHQNDASEFCDQLLDRIESATRGKYTKQDVWTQTIQRKIFGGKTLYQKIPQDCDAYKTDKRECGHWQSSRMESFLKLELIIRGKDKIDDSLEEMVAGELMDGDNKIECEVCTQKKATVRRTCIGRLPNTMILHLKRFDLDFTTFETVKLNNRMAFATKLNLLKYTKEGIEDEERRKEKAAAGGAGGGATGDAGTNGGRTSRGKDDEEPISYDNGEEVNYTAPDPADYEYELQGVLVHAGIAQGGHYYSFVKDSSSVDKWYRFDDEDVSTFNPDHISAQCFGGPPMSANGVVSSVEEERTANALMLFFKKVKPIDNPPDEPQAPATTSSSGSPETNNGEEEHFGSNQAGVEVSKLLVPGKALPGSLLVNGYEAFGREVREANLQHVLMCYLLDADLHAFVRGLILSIANADKLEKGGPLSVSVSSEFVPLRWSPSQAPSLLLPGDDGIKQDLVLTTMKFGCEFLIDVLLHCRERGAMRAWSNALKEGFDTFPQTALWFLQTLLRSDTNAWLEDYLLYCQDALSRATFVQIVAQAASAVAPQDPEALTKYISMSEKELRAQFNSAPNAAVMTALLVREVLDKILEAPRHMRVIDELFTLIRDLAAIPCVCNAILRCNTIPRLVYFANPETAHPDIKNLFAGRASPNSNNNRLPSRADYFPLMPGVFEALAALVGVPQSRKVPMLQERTGGSSYWESELVPEAREALTRMFKDVAGNGSIDAHALSQYLERVNGPGYKVNHQQLKMILDRYTASDGRIGLDGFLQYHTESASNNPKSVWRDLHAFGFRNDLSWGETATAADGIDFSNLSPLSTLPLTELTRGSLASITLYESGMDTAEASAKAIAKRVCLNDQTISSALLRQALGRIHRISTESSWVNDLGGIIEFIRVLLSIEDDLQIPRVQAVLLDQNFGLATVAFNERSKPSSCRVNDYDRSGLLHRYVSFVQDLTNVPVFLDTVHKLAEEDSRVRLVRGLLRLRPGSTLIYDDETMLRASTVRVEGAGRPEVDGTYLFVDIRSNAGYYSKRGVFEGKEVNFTLYKCSVNNGGHQWFISITPEGSEPGTSKDIDFYFCQARTQEVYGNVLPPKQFGSMDNNNSVTRNPGPSVIVDLPQRETEDGGLVFADTATAANDNSFDSNGSYGEINVVNHINPRSLNNLTDGDTSSDDEGSMVVGNDDTDGNIEIEDSYISGNSGVDSPDRDYSYDDHHSHFINNFDSV